MAMRRIKVKETIDRRILGALRFVDHVTGSMVRRPMAIIAPNVKFITNRSRLQVISCAIGLEGHLTSFNEPLGASLKKFDMTIQDPLGEYLDRSMTLKLPLDPDPEENNSIFEPVDVPLFAAPAAHLSPNWSVIRASIYDLADLANERPVPGALLRILDSGGSLMMSGMSDERGEAIVIIPGIPISSFAQEEELPPEGPDDEDWLASGSVVETETPVTLQVVVTPDAPWPVDPGKMEQNNQVWRRHFRDADNDEAIEVMELALRTGKTQSIKLFIDLTE